MDSLGDCWLLTASRLSFLTLLGTKGLSTRGQLLVSEIFVATVCLGSTTGIQWVEFKATVKHPTIHRASPIRPTMNYHNVSSAMAEKLIEYSLYKTFKIHHQQPAFLPGLLHFVNSYSLLDLSTAWHCRKNRGWKKFPHRCPFQTVRT